MLAIRHGPGAMILPPEITRIHLDFAQKSAGGHMGPRCATSHKKYIWATSIRPQTDPTDRRPPPPLPDRRKFWKICLPRLKFWNPATPMLVNRTADTSAPAKLSIYFRQTPLSDASSTTPTPAALLSKFNELPLAQQPHSSTSNEYPAPEPEEGERVVTIDVKNVHSDAILAEFTAKTGAVPVQPTPDELSEMRQLEELTERGAFDRAIMKKYFDDQRREERMLALAHQEAEAIKKANT
ncbi:CI-B8 domain-containing protein [Durotheca rogersii]|uniref:CI-B8 domain-containing protein n=1 Tax=Durotheca rogersii TaxID=419775 RepID=UPI00221F561B|nr:CI-B8 domain-containing protein [Durotheca rogersii]KAI5864228.1 CI-B8 domain-containing protein [Durotheca rogersii]